MEKELKDELIAKLINQQTIVQNSSSETDFRRAEVTANIIGRIIDLENLLETQEIKEKMGIPTVEFDLPRRTNETVSETKPFDKDLIDVRTERRESVKSRIIALLVQKNSPLTANEIAEGLGIANQNIQVQLSVMSELTKFPRKDGVSRCRFSFGLKEWKYKPEFQFKKEEEDEDDKPYSPVKVKTHDKPEHKLDIDKIPTSKHKTLNGYRIGEEVHFLDVMRNRETGIIVYLAESGEMTGKRAVAAGDTATIKQISEGTGKDNLYDRPFNMFKKIQKS